MSSSAGHHRVPLTIVSGHCSQQGVRPSMEDEVLIKENFTLSNAHPSVAGPLSFYGVFDGHGGRQAAIYTRDHMFQFLQAELEQGKQPTEALRQAFLQTDSTFIAACRGDDKEGGSKDEQMEKERDGAASAQPAPSASAAPANPHVPPPINTSPSASAIPSSSSLDHDTSGTTAVAILVCHATHMLYVAHVGDSRAILLSVSASSVSPLTNDHKADRPDEVERIRAAGGFVVHKRVMGELAISRAIGDMDFKRPSSSEPGFNFVVADPEVGERQVKDEEDVLLLACDGLYDVMTNEKVAEYVRAALQETGGQVQRVAESIVSHAIDKLFTRDNVTVIVVHLRKDGGGNTGAAAGGAATVSQDGGEPHHAPHIHHVHHHSHPAQAQQAAPAAAASGDSQHHHAAHKHHAHHHHEHVRAVPPPTTVVGSTGEEAARVEVVHMQSDS